MLSLLIARRESSLSCCCQVVPDDDLKVPTHNLPQIPLARPYYVRLVTVVGLMPEFAARGIIATREVLTMIALAC